MREIIKKLGFLLATLFMIVTLTFVLMKAIPGDPFSQEQALPKEIHKALKEHYGLDKPLYIQYLSYLKSVATWNLGPSFKYKERTVNDVIREGFPVSLLLGSEALFLSIGFGILLGAVSAMTSSRYIQSGAMLFAILGISIPNFAIATLLQYVLSMKMGLFPVARWGTILHTILPAISLAALPTAFIARLTQTKIREVLGQSFIRTARAKGLSDFQIVRKHVLRNALLPIFGYLGQLTANVLVGSFVIEKIFSIPGLGQWFVNSVMNRDYTLIMGLTLFYGLILILNITLFDLVGRALDPRLRHQEASETL